MDDQALTREELLDALAKCQAQVRVLQKALLEGTTQAGESRYKEIVEGQTEMVSRWLPDTTVTFVNKAYCDYFGHPVEEVLGTKFLPNLPEEAQRVVQDSVKKLTSGETDHLITEELSYDAHGQPHWIQWTYGVVRDENGKLIELQSVGRDVSTLHETRVALEQANLLVEQSPVVFFQRKIVDNKLDEILYVSENVQQYGFTAEDFTSGRVPFEQTIHPDDLQRVGEILIGNLANKVDEYELEYRSVLPGDRMVWFALQAQIKRDEQGQAVLQQGTFIDITESKQAEELLAEALDIATLAYWEFDVAKGSFLFNDDYYQRILHTTVEKAGGYWMPAQTFAMEYVNPEDAASVPAKIQEALQSTDLNYQGFAEARLRGGDGQERNILMRMRIIKDAEGNTIKLYGTNQDVTESKQAEELLARRAQELATVAEVGTSVATVLEPEEMLQQVVDLTKERFGLYHAHVYLLDESGETLVLRSGAGEVGRQMVAEKRSIPLEAEQSLVARAARTRQGVTVNDVRSDPDFLPHPLLPETRSELAVPLVVGSQVLGVLDVQSEQVGRFTEEDIRIQTTLASQVAVALQNARQYELSRQSEALVRSIIDGIPDWIFLKDTQYRFMMVNKSFADAMHLTFAEMLGKTDLEVGFPEELVMGDPEKGIAGFRVDDQRVIETGETQIITDDVVQVDGEEKILYTTKSPLRNASGEVIGMLGIGRDVSELRQASEQLKEALEIASLAYWEFDVAKGSFLFNNDYYQRILHTTAEKAGGYWMPAQTFAMEYVNPEDAASVPVKIQEALQAEDPNYEGFTEARLRGGDGKERNILMRMRIVKDAEGNTIKLYGTNQDITDRKQAEFELQQSEERFRSLVSNITGAVYRCALDADYTMYFISEPIQAISGYPAEDFIGNKERTYASIIHPEDLALVDEAINKTVETREPYFIEYRIRTADGSERWVSEGGRVVFTEGDQVNWLDGAIFDITERKQAEARLAEALDIATLAYWELDIATLTFRFNDDLYERILHITAEEAGGYLMPAQKFASTYMHPDDAPLVQSLTQEALETDDPNYENSAEVRYLCGDGKERNILMRFRIVKDAEGNTIRTYGTNQDVTESKQAEELLARRAQELATVAEVGTSVATVLEPEEMLQSVVDLTKERFGLYHAHVYLLDESGETLVLRSGAGEVGRQMVAEKRSIPLEAEQSLVARAARTRQGVTVNDVRSDPDFLPHPLLPETRSELAVPLVVGSQVLGVLDVQSEQVGRFTEEDIRIQTTLASQVAVALQNARQYEQVNDSEKLIRTIIDSTPDWIFVKDLDHRYVMVNEGYGKSLHITPEDFIGKNDIDLGFPEELVKGNPEKGIRGFWADDRQIFETDAPIFFENDIVQIDGQRRIYSTLKTPLHDADGKVSGVLAFARDVTEREEASQALEDAITVVEQSPVIVFRRKVVNNILDKILYVSDNVKRYGYTAEDFTTGRVPFEQTVHPDDLQFVGETLIGNLQNNVDNYQFEYRGVFPGDVMTWFTLQATIERDGNGEAVLQVGTIIDITEIKEAQLAVAENEARFRTLVDAVPDMIFRFDATGKFVDFKGAEGGTYVPPEVFLGKHYAEVLPPNVATLTTEALEKGGAEEKTQTFEYQLPNEKGDQDIFEARIITNETGEAVGLIRNVTEQRTATVLLGKRAQELATVAEVGTAVSTVLDPEEMLQSVVDLTKERFGLYHAHVYLLDESGETLVLRSGAGEVGRQMVAEKRSIPLEAEQSLVARAARTRQGVTVNDVRSDPDFLPHPLLPETRSELAVPLVVGSQVLGVLDVQSEQVGRFTEEDIRIQTTLASQVAVALQNARQFEEISRLGKIVETSQDGMVITTMEGIVEFANQAMAKMHGYEDAKDLIGKPLMIFQTEEQLQEVMPLMAQMMASPEGVVAEVGHVRRDGTEFATRMVGQVLRNEDGVPYAVVTGIQDITDRKQAEFELQQSEERFRSLVSNITGAVYRCALDADYTMYFISEPIQAISGYPAEDFIGNKERTYASIIHPEDLALVDEAINKTIETREPYFIEYRIRTADGSERWVSEGGRVVFTEGDQVNWLDGAIFDITERKQAEARLAEALDIATLAYWEFDVTNGSFLFNDDYYQRILHTTAEKAGGYWMPAQTFAMEYVNPEDAASVPVKIQEALQAEDPNYEGFAEARLRGGDGKERNVLMRMRIIKNAEGKTIRLYGTNQDVTESKQAEELLARRAQELATVAELGTAVSTVLEPEEMLQQVVDLTKERFGLYHAHVYLLDESSETLVLRSGAGEVGRQMVAEKRSIPLEAEQSLVARAARTRQGVTVNDVRSDPDFLPHPLLPETRSELAVPLVVGSQVLGVLDVQSEQVGRFTEEDIRIQTTLASQVAVALQNARQYEQVRQSEQLVRTMIDSTSDWIFVKDLDHRYVLVNKGYADSLHITPEDFIGKNDIDLGFPEELVKGNPEKGIRGFWADDKQVFETNQPLTIENDVVMIDGKERNYSTVKTPLRDANNKVIGVLAFGRDVTEREELLKETRSQAEQEALINAISQKIQATTTVENALQVAIRELGQSLGAKQTSVRLGVDKRKN